jgi:hypothetical protein
MQVETRKTKKKRKKRNIYRIITNAFIHYNGLEWGFSEL